MYLGIVPNNEYHERYLDFAFLLNELVNDRFL